jgi:hypothetical protein
MVHQETYILSTEQPCLCWGSSTIHDSVDTALERLDVTFSIVLMLLVRFTLPVLYEQCAEKILNALADFNLSTVTDEAMWCSPFTDVVFKRVDKLAITTDTVDVRDSSVAANKQDCSS